MSDGGKSEETLEKQTYLTIRSQREYLLTKKQIKIIISSEVQITTTAAPCGTHQVYIFILL